MKIDQSPVQKVGWGEKNEDITIVRKENMQVTYNMKCYWTWFT